MISAYRYYTNSTTICAYSLPVNPVPSRMEWDTMVPNDVKSVTIHPPIIANKRGRPKNKRIPSQGEDAGSTPRVSHTRRCSKCLGPNHNKATCKGTEFVPHPQPQ